MKFGKKGFSLLFLIVFVCAPTFSLRGQTPEGKATLPGEEKVADKKNVEKEEVEEEEEEFEGEEEKIYLNVQDQDIKEVIKQISKATRRNFIIDAKVSGKITILSNKMMTKQEAYQAFLSALQVAGFTTVLGPAGIIKIVSLRDAKTYPIPTHVDTTPYTDSYVTRLIKLENINAKDMAGAIKPLISRNGNMFAYAETNTLVLTDSGTNIDRLMKIIKELDQEGPQEVVEIIPIHFAGAKEIASILESLFEKGRTGRGRRGSAAAKAGPDIAKVSKIIADERTNAIIVMASKRDLDKVKNLINRLDAKLEEGHEGKVHVHYLKHATAKDLVEVLQGLAGQTKKPPGKGGKGKSEGPTIASLEDFKIAADDATNSLLITSTPKTYRTLVEKVIEKLDIPRKQVYLEALIIEFAWSRTKASGVTTSAGGGGSIVGFQQTFKQFANLIDPFAAGSSILSSPGLLGGILSRKTADIKFTNADGTSRTVTVPAFSAFLTALNSFGDTNLVASPNLLALDNEEASIEIIRKEPEPGTSTLSATGTIQQGRPERIEAGLRLKLTPQITERGTVRLKIDQEFSSFATPENITLGTQAIVTRKVVTSVVTNDGQTVVIGGLMEDKTTVTKTKVPLLGDIPLIGWLFKTTDNVKKKTNLLLFITPHIIRDNSDFEKVLRRKIGQQADFIKNFYKRKQRRILKTTIGEHHPGLLDYANEEAVTQGGFQMPPGARLSSRPPVITARPDDEERHRVTIILPPSVSQDASRMASSERQSQSFERKKAKKKKRRSKKIAAPVYVAPAPAPAPVAPARAPVVTIPSRQIEPQARAMPVPEEPVAAPAPVAPAPVPQKKLKKVPGHAPVITLPPGTPPDLWD